MPLRNLKKTRVARTPKVKRIFYEETHAQQNGCKKKKNDRMIKAALVACNWQLCICSYSFFYLSPILAFSCIPG